MYNVIHLIQQDVQIDLHTITIQDDTKPTTEITTYNFVHFFVIFFSKSARIPPLLLLLLLPVVLLILGRLEGGAVSDVGVAGVDNLCSWR